MARKRAVELVSDPTLVSFDPGGTTGWSILVVHPDALRIPDVPILGNIVHWAHGEIGGDENEQASQMLGIATEWPGACVLFEDFILEIMLKSRELLSPVRITAKAEYAFWLHKVRTFRQGREVAKRTATDDRLKRWGFYQREGGLGHARDADRHGLTWLRQCKQHAWLRAECWPYLFGPAGEFATGTE
jgi:hypothetical protein